MEVLHLLDTSLCPQKRKYVEQKKHNKKLQQKIRRLEKQTEEYRKELGICQQEAGLLIYLIKNDNRVNTVSLQFNCIHIVAVLKFLNFCHIGMFEQP